MQYFMTVPAGSTDLAERALSHLRPDARVTFRDDSALEFSTDRAIPDADQVPFAKNIFAVLGRTPRRELASSVQALARAVPPVRLSRAEARSGFRVMLHVDGSLASVDRSARQALERSLSRATRATPSPRGGGEEFWVVGRRDLGDFLLGRRLHRSRPPHKLRGALAPELSSLVVSVSEPDPRDVVLDPFAGSGALLLARLGWPVRALLYNDREAARWRPDLPQDLSCDRRVRFAEEDVRELRSVSSGSVSAIVTDPPWNEHESVDDYTELIAQACDTFARVLHPRHGRAVVLVNRRGAELFAGRLDAAGMTTETAAEVLVNGHPASVLLAVSRGRRGALG